ncbi:MAG: hypothetical protein E7197_05930 [Anaerovibrio sp.]|uniref:hypothetical protein n=1 Tax=Anaerovibrio sp. TaxID=1872532 RepID=UPI0025C389E1|nr:hypothetical protein [Anaerovibrio sp.]MBE6099578.1 hypothetical protein [Anaerovibrio sp.]
MFDAIWYSFFPPDSALELFIDQLPDLVWDLSKTEPLLCSFIIILSLGLTVLICMPFDMLFNHSKIFEINTFSEYLKAVVVFPIVLIVGTLLLWLPIMIFGRIIAAVVYPFEWIASFILGIVYSIVSFFI